MGGQSYARTCPQCARLVPLRIGTCRCGHVNRSEPGRCPTDPLWTVGLTEWHLVGPLLVSLLVCLSHRMHLSRRRIQEFPCCKFSSDEYQTCYSMSKAYTFV